MEAQQEVEQVGWMRLIAAFFFNHVGVEVQKDVKAKVVEKWSQSVENNLDPVYSTALDNGDFLITTGVDSVRYFVCADTKDGEVIFRVSEYLYKKVSRGSSIEADYQIGRFDGSKLNGRQIYLPTHS